ncbi:MAG: octaprenyl-diphosphate synthase [Rickettsiales bacterium]
MSNKNNKIFTQIVKEITPELELVNQIILGSSKGKASLIGEVTNHLVSGGGKRLRPILTIISSKLCGYDSGDRHCNLAAAVELIHSATLLHDDVVDESSLRRGRKTANAIWDNKASILVGDYLLSVAFQLMTKDGSLEVLDLLSQTSGIMSDGEVLQLMNSNDIEISEDTYLKIIASKTAILFSSATKVGAIITNCDESRKKSLSDFGSNLGVAFQIIDDILDYCADEKTLGKEIGEDFFEGKITLPIIITYKKSSEAEKSRIKAIFADNLISDKKDNKLFVEMMVLIKKHDGLKESFEKAVSYQNIAINNLEIFPDNQAKSMLVGILEYGISRKK